MRNGKRVLAAVAVGLVAVAGVAAGAMGAEGHHDHRVELRHGAFEPAEVEVEVGEKVTWVNRDDHPQSVTADGGAFDSHPDCSESAPGRCMERGETFAHTFTEPGRYPYHSKTEGGPGGKGMSGVVTVVEEHGHDH